MVAKQRPNKLAKSGVGECQIVRPHWSADCGELTRGPLARRATAAPPCVNGRNYTSWEIQGVVVCIQCWSGCYRSWRNTHCWWNKFIIVETFIVVNFNYFLEFHCCNIIGRYIHYWGYKFGEIYINNLCFLKKHTLLQSCCFGIHY